MPQVETNRPQLNIPLMEQDSTRRILIGFLLCMLSAIALLENNGLFGRILAYIPVFLFGNLYIVFTAILGIYGLVLLSNRSIQLVINNRVKLSCVFLFVIILVSFSNNNLSPNLAFNQYLSRFKSLQNFGAISVVTYNLDGGIIGIILYSLLISMFGGLMTQLIIIIALFGSLFFVLKPVIYSLGQSWMNRSKKKNSKKKNKFDKVDEQINIEKEPTLEERLSRIKVEDHNLRGVQKVNHFFIKEDEIKQSVSRPTLDITPPTMNTKTINNPILQKHGVTSSVNRAVVFDVFKDKLKEDDEHNNETPAKTDTQANLFFDFNFSTKKSQQKPAAFTPKAENEIPVYEAPIIEKINPIKEQVKFEIPPQNEAKIDVVQVNEHPPIKPATHTEKKDHYQFPSIELLKQESIIRTSAARATAQFKAELLDQKLASFGIDASVKNFVVAPAFTRFEIELGPLAKMQQFVTVKSDLMGALSAEKINVLTPIPGSQYVGVEIPNKERSTVSFKEVLADIPFESRNNKLLVALGKNIVGNVITTELNKAPHILIAGQTGSGKSVCINTIILALIMRCHPDEVKLILVDPKRVELSVYANIPHLICPVITDPKKAAVALSKLVEEIEDRFKILENTGFKNIEGYNIYARENNLKPLPYIITIIDELADLMLVASKLVEDSIRRITAIARAAGIHLIVATQRPSVDVITGVIKANIPTRIAFAVSSGIDSRTIIDEIGAEELLGNGDLMYKHPSLRIIERIQGAFVSDSDIESVVEFVRKQAKPNYEEKFSNLDLVNEQMNLADSLGIGTPDSEDERYQDVIDFLKTVSIVSTSALQRKFGFGFQRAARIIDRLENDKYISPANGSKPRDVYHANIEG